MLYSNSVHRLVLGDTGGVVVRSKPFGPLSIASKAWFASLTPLTSALVAFSFVLVAFGSSVYLASVPPMVVADKMLVSPLMEKGEDAPITPFPDMTSEDFSELAGSIYDDDYLFRDIDAANGKINNVDQVANAVNTSNLSIPIMDLIKDTLNIPTTPSANPETPSVDDPNAGQNPGTNKPTEPDKPSSGSNTGGDDPIVTPPVEEPDPGLPAETELKIRNALATIYNDLPSYYETTAGYYTYFAENHDSEDLQLRKSAYTTVLRAYSKPSGCLNGPLYAAIGATSVPKDSKWYPQYEDLKAMANDLVQANVVMVNAWRLNSASGLSPSEPGVYEKYMAPIWESSIDGQSKYLLDFKQRYESFSL